MAKPEWGIKRICPHCETRYYDFCKNPPVCPSCKAAYDAETLLKSRKNRAAKADGGKGKEAENAAIAPDAILPEDAETAPAEAAGEGSNLLEDTSELDTEEEIEVKLEDE